MPLPLETKTLNGLSTYSSYQEGIKRTLLGLIPILLVAKIGTGQVIAQEAVEPKGTSLHFDGKDDQIVVSSAPELNIYAGTLEAWIKITHNDNEVWNAIIAKELAYELTLFENRLATYDWTTQKTHAYGPDLNDGRWHHVAFSFEDGKENGSQLYLDGLPIDRPFRYNILNLGSELYVGNNRFNPQYFNGQIDEVRVWNRPLSANEIKLNYHHELVGWKQNGLVLYLRFNQGASKGDNRQLSSAHNDVPNDISTTLMGFALNGNTSNFIADTPVQPLQGSRLVFLLIKHKGLILLAILLVLLVYFIVVWRTRQLRSRNQKLEELIRSKTEKLVASLNEKEVLIKEIHHRVKNNLQVISGLLELQSKNIDNERAKDALIISRNRVQSVALVHHNLYQLERFGTVRVKNFADDLFLQLSTILKKEGQNVEFFNNISDIELDLDTAVPFGLILNELITNSYKYAFASVSAPQISMSLTAVDGHLGKSYALIYADNGKGLGDHADLRNSNTLGLRLIADLTRQLKGTIEYRSEGGAVFHITFRDRTFRQNED